MRKVAGAKVSAEEVEMTIPMINLPTTKRPAIKVILPVKNISKIITQVRNCLKSIKYVILY